MKEIVHVLNTMSDEAMIPFVKRQTNEQLYFIVSILRHTNEKTQEKWEVIIEDILKIS